MNNEEKTCDCGLPMIRVDHYEDDGDRGSHEPYYECPDNCEEEE